MKTRIIFVILLCLIISSSVVYASDISGAVYQATIRVTNNSTATTNISVPFTLDSQYLLDNGFVNSSFNNTAIIGIGGSDVAYMPGSNSTNPWIVYVPSIGENSQINNTLYMGGDDMAAKLSYFSGTGGMTTSDHASLELGDNFTITLSDVWINTTAGAGKNIFRKIGAIDVHIDSAASGKVTADIYEQSSVTLTADGSETAITYTSSGTHWQASDAAGGAYCYQTTPGYLRDLYACDDIAADAIVGSVTVYAYGMKAAGTGYLKTSIRTGGTTYDGDENALTTSYVYYSTSYSLNPDTGEAWTGAEVNAMEIGANIKADGSNQARLDHVYAVVTIVDASVSLSNISTGEYDIYISADTSDLSLQLNGSSNSTSLAGASVPDNANDIISFENDTVLYAGSQEIEVDGVQVQYVEWEYGTTFSDSSGNSNDATPTFRTTSSDADVSAEMLDFEPYSTADIGEYSIEEESYMIDEAPDEPDDLYDTVNESALDIPDTLLPGMFNPLLDNATIPRSFFWIMVAFCTAMAGGLIAYGGVTKLKGESVSFASADSFALFIQALVSGLILVIWIVATGGSVIPAWIMAPYVIIELAAILLVRRGVA